MPHELIRQRHRTWYNDHDHTVAEPIKAEHYQAMDEVIEVGDVVEYRQVDPHDRPIAFQKHRSKVGVVSSKRGYWISIKRVIAGTDRVVTDCVHVVSILVCDQDEAAYELDWDKSTIHRLVHNVVHPDNPQLLPTEGGY